MTSTLRKRRRLLEKPKFKNWFDLPFEMREIVIDNMDPKARCRFAQCSKMCEEEAKKSKNYLYGIKVFAFGDGPLVLSLTHQQTQPIDYHLEFIDAENDQTIVAYRYVSDKNNVYYGCRGDLKWAKAENGKPNDVRIRYFEEYIEKYKNSIRNINFIEGKDPIHNFSIEKLKKLEELVIFAALDEDSDWIERGFVNWNQLFRVKDLRAPSGNIDFTFENIINLTGNRINISSSSLDQMEVNKYLKMLQKGEIHEDLIEIVIYCEKRFDVPFIMQGLDTFNYSENGIRSRFSKEYQFDFRSDKKNRVFHVKCLSLSRIEIH